jgi:pimeloyl-ACP methyl ester carboxylesterase
MTISRIAGAGALSATMGVLLVVAVGHTADATPRQIRASPAGTGDCAGLANARLANVVITSAALNPANAPVSGGNSPSMMGEPGKGAPITGLPAFCRVIGEIHPEAGSDIRFEVWLPAEGWDGRFNGANSGGLAGYINYLDLASAVRAGQAAAGSDVGHQAMPGDARWAAGNPQKVRDYGWRGVHLTTTTAKQLIKFYYGKGPDKSYFIGCSNGGRQALMEASRFPEDYDGIVAGAPAVSLTDATITLANALQAQNPAGAAIRPEQAELISGEVLKQCDSLDGQVDGLVENPLQCRFDSSKLACGSNPSPLCFTPQQITALDRIQHGARTSRGKSVGMGYPANGGESGQPFKQLGWEGNILARFRSAVGPDTYSNGILKYFPKTTFATDDTFDFDRHPARLAREVGVDTDARPDLRRFFARGGKLIIWHGWSDPLLSPMAAVNYHEAALRQSGAGAKNNMRLFMLPGVTHCVGGPGPDAIGQIGAPRPGDDPAASVGAAIQHWVEKDRVPESIAGRTGMVALMMNPKTPSSERLICAWPKHAVLTAGQDPAKAASYTCQPANKIN